MVKTACGYLCDRSSPIPASDSKAGGGPHTRTPIGLIRMLQARVVLDQNSLRHLCDRSSPKQYATPTPTLHMRPERISFLATLHTGLCASPIASYVPPVSPVPAFCPPLPCSWSHTPCPPRPRCLFSLSLSQDTCVVVLQMCCPSHTRGSLTPCHGSRFARRPAYRWTTCSRPRSAG